MVITHAQSFLEAQGGGTTRPRAHRWRTAGPDLGALSDSPALAGPDPLSVTRPGHTLMSHPLRPRVPGTPGQQTAGRGPGCQPRVCQTLRACTEGRGSASRLPEEPLGWRATLWVPRHFWASLMGAVEDPHLTLLWGTPRGSAALLVYTAESPSCLGVNAPPRARGCESSFAPTELSAGSSWRRPLRGLCPRSHLAWSCPAPPCSPLLPRASPPSLPWEHITCCRSLLGGLS